MNTKKHIGIVMSGGKGLRIGGDIPKQYMDLAGKPVLYYSLKAMQDSFIDEIIIVAAKEYIDYVKEEIVDRFSFTKVTAVVEGGEERSDSVYNGLMAIKEPETSYVYIQDGARPLLSVEMLEASREDASVYGSSVMAVPAKDTIKVVNDNGFVVTTPDRKHLWNVQTPQTFFCSDLIRAYCIFRKTEGAFVTDDASVMEQFGDIPVHITKGDYCNIKITTPEDFETAERFLK